MTVQLRHLKSDATVAERAAAFYLDRNIGKVVFLSGTLEQLEARFRQGALERRPNEIAYRRWDTAAHLADNLGPAFSRYASAHLLKNVWASDKTGFVSALAYDDLPSGSILQGNFLALVVSLADGQVRAATRNLLPVEQVEISMGFRESAALTLVTEGVSMMRIGLAVGTALSAGESLKDTLHHFNHQGPWTYIDKMNLTPSGDSHYQVDRLEWRAQELAAQLAQIKQLLQRNPAFQNSLQQIPEQPLHLESALQNGGGEADPFEKLSNQELCYLYRYLLYLLVSDANQRPLFFEDGEYAVPSDRNLVLKLDRVVSIMTLRGQDLSACLAEGYQGEAPTVDFCGDVALPRNRRLNFSFLRDAQQVFLDKQGKMIFDPAVKALAAQLVIELRKLSVPGIERLINSLQTSPADVIEGFIFQAQRALHYWKQGKLREVEAYRRKDGEEFLFDLIIDQNGVTTAIEVKDWSNLGRRTSTRRRELREKLFQQLTRLRRFGLPLQVDWRGQPSPVINDGIRQLGVGLNSVLPGND